MATATQTAPKAKSANTPKRVTVEDNGVKYDYVRMSATMAKLFGLEDKLGEFPSLSAKVPVRIYYVHGTDVEIDHPLVPEINVNYKFDVWELAVLLPYFISGKGFPPYVFGLQGTGKSSLIEQIHARLGLPRAQVILGEDSEVIDLGGQMLPTEAGGMRFFDGLLVQSMRNGWTLQFDEWDLLPTRQQKMLNEVLENRRFTIEVTGEQVEAHPDWRVCVTANTNNTGSGGHMFVSSGAGDASVNERFQFLKKRYLEREDEKAILSAVAERLLKKHPVVKRNPDKADHMKVGVMEIVEQMLNVSEAIRTAHENSMKASGGAGMALGCTLSTRGLKEWLRSTLDLSAFFEGAKGNVMADLTRQAYMMTFVMGVSEEEQEDVLQIFDDVTGNSQ
jgi:AAA ATPase containing von Willebrand factor type A (vWA) domain